MRESLQRPLLGSSVLTLLLSPAILALSSSVISAVFLDGPSSNLLQAVAGMLSGVLASASMAPLGHGVTRCTLILAGALYGIVAFAVEKTIAVHGIHLVAAWL